MRVKAVAPGYDNITVRHPEEVFDLPDGTPMADWFVKVDEEGHAKAPAKFGKQAAPSKVDKDEPFA